VVGGAHEIGDGRETRGPRRVTPARADTRRARRRHPAPNRHRLPFAAIKQFLCPAAIALGALADSVGMQLSPALATLQSEALCKPRHGGGRRTRAPGLFGHREQGNLGGMVDHLARGLASCGESSSKQLRSRSCRLDRLIAGPLDPEPIVSDGPICTACFGRMLALVGPSMRRGCVPGGRAEQMADLNVPFERKLMHQCGFPLLRTV
jgi:hypothetical protein